MPSPLRRSLRGLRGLALPSLWCLGVTIFLNDTYYETIAVFGESMTPTLSPLYNETGRRDFLLLRKSEPTRDLKRGDIVSFWSPWKPERLAVKRVVGVEGDTVLLDTKRRPKGSGGALDADGDSKEGKQWDIMGEVQMDGFGDARVTGKRSVKVPFGHVWVEGDNWRKTADSNMYGPISKSLITGKAICVVWPPARFGAKPWDDTTGLTKIKSGQRTVPIAWEDL